MLRSPGLALALAAVAAPAARGAFAQEVCPEATLVLPAPTAEARFGWSVALDGTTAALSAPFGNGATGLSGLVKIVARTPGGWSETAQLVASDGLSGDGFGSELALQGDRLVVGAVWKDGPGVNSGGVYVFERVGGVWSETAQLQGSDAAPGDWFGRAVDVDGDRIVVGASLKANPAAGQGAVYVFERAGFAWVETAKLAASDGAGNDFFGGALDLDGDRLLIGAHGKDDVGAEAGGAYVFERVGAIWVETRKLLAADGKPHDDLGIEVALAGDVALLAAFGDDDAASDAGSAYVFERDATGAWIERQQLFASDAKPGDGLGSGIALDGGAPSGMVAAIGAEHVALGGPKAGAVYAFRRDAATGLFHEEARFDGAPPGALLGFDVAISGDLILGGAPESPAAATAAGEARAARLAGGATLFGCPAWISLSAGGVQTLDVAPGPAFAGDVYFVAGSVSGSSPGFVYGGVAVPLNLDGYLVFTIGHPNSPPFQATLGTLDGAGLAAAAIALPPGTAPSLAGTSLVHAALVLDPVTWSARVATPAAPLVLLP